MVETDMEWQCNVGPVSVYPPVSVYVYTNGCGPTMQ